MTARIAALVWLALVILAGAYLVGRIHEGPFFRTDLSSLLPREEQNPALQTAYDAVTDKLAHRIVVLVGDADKAVARKAAGEITQELEASGLFRISTDLPDKDKFRQIGSFYYPYLYGLLSDADRDLLKHGHGPDIADRAASQVYGMFGISDPRLLHNDPFLLLPSFLESLPLPSTKLLLDDGLLEVEDHGTSWVLIAGELTDAPFSLDAQTQIVGKLDSTIAEVKVGNSGLKALRLGTVFFAKAASDESMHETSLIALFSTLGTIVLVLLVFRSISPLLLSLLVIGTGVLVAMSACLFIFGEIHVGALLFGVTLIGVSVDYSLQYCTEIFARPFSPPTERLKRVRGGITLGATTTIIGYLTLCLAPFPGLHQIAAFSALGLVASWLTVVFWLPLLDRQAILTHGERMLRATERFLDFWTLPRFRRPCLGLFGVTCLLGFVGYLHFRADDDIHHMQSLSNDLLTQQAQIQKLVGFDESAQFFLVDVPDDETALEREENLADALAPLVKAGDLTGFQAPAQFIPSLRRQKDNRQLQIDTLYEPLLRKQTSNLGLTDGPVAPDPLAPLLTLDTARLAGARLPFLSTLLLSGTAGDRMHAVMLDHVTNTEALSKIADMIPGVHFMSPADDFTRLLTKYRHRAIVLLVLSAFLMLPLMIWRYGIAKGLWVMLPPTFAVILAPALRALTGGTFTFFDAMALVLIFSIGVDYAVFCAETSGARKRVTMLAVTMAACTALMSFGFLALSNVSAVHNFGATMTIGILLSFLFSPLAALSRRAHAKLSVTHIIALALVLFSSGCANESPLPEGAVRVAPHLDVSLPSPASLGRNLEATQLVTAHYGDQEFAFEARISAVPSRFMLVGMDLSGQRLFSIIWTEGGIKYEKASFVPSELRPENILADIVLLYWPGAVVKQLLAGQARLVDTSSYRAIYQDQEKLWYAAYATKDVAGRWNTTLAFHNLAYGYRFDVQSKEDGH